MNRTEEVRIRISPENIRARCRFGDIETGSWLLSETGCVCIKIGDERVWSIEQKEDFVVEKDITFFPIRKVKLRLKLKMERK